MCTVVNISRIKRLEMCEFPVMAYTKIIITQYFSFKINHGAYFCILSFSFKVFTAAWIIPSFGEQIIFVNFYSVVFSWIIPLS